MTLNFRALLPALAALVALVGFAALPATARADDYADTVQLFKNAGQSGTFFDKAYGYAVFPTVGKGGLVLGGARGKGRVYAQGKYTGDTTLTQVSVGFQAGGQAYSQIVFFEDERAYREFTSGEFGFGAGVSAVAITAAASATASTTGNSAGVSGGKKDATTTGEYYKGMAVFTIARGGLMYEAALAGQKFSFRAKKAE
jgi:lipid-binding SYLF domain-containing protein